MNEDNGSQKSMNQSSEKIRVLHIITSLLADGAQHMLLKLCENVDRSKFDFRILNLRGETPFAKRFVDIGVPVEHLNMRPALPSFRALRQIGQAIDAFQPSIVQGWMYHGNMAATAGRAISRHSPTVLWNVRKAVENVNEYRPLTRVTLAIGAALSKKAAGIIYCGEYVARQHALLGYSKEKEIIIANGFDTTRFQPSLSLREETRAQLGLPQNVFVIGMTARFHPHKDHRNFLEMAARVACDCPNVHFVLAGRGLEASNRELCKWVEELHLQEKLTLLGEYREVQKLLPAFDVYCLSSSAEGFPNSLGEAMACGIPCVTTNAGASQEVIDQTGIVVPVHDSKSLAQGVLQLLSLSAEERANLGACARERVLQHFSLASIALQYQSCYERAAHSPNIFHFHSPSIRNERVVENLRLQ